MICSIKGLFLVQENESDWDIFVICYVNEVPYHVDRLVCISAINCSLRLVYYIGECYFQSFGQYFGQDFNIHIYRRYWAVVLKKKNVTIFFINQFYCTYIFDIREAMDNNILNIRNEDSLNPI